MSIFCPELCHPSSGKENCNGVHPYIPWTMLPGVIFFQYPNLNVFHVYHFLSRSSASRLSILVQKVHEKLPMEHSEAV